MQIARLSGMLATLALMAGPAAAATVNLDAFGNATGVTDLVVGTIIYDVSFTGEKSGAFWANNLPFANQNDAEIAAQALVNALQSTTTELVTWQQGVDTFTTGFVQSFYGTFMDLSDPSEPVERLLGAFTAFAGGWFNGLSNGTTTNENEFPFAAVWTRTGIEPSPIPVPASLPLALGGLAMLGLMARHRRV